MRQALELRALRFGCHTHPQLQREVCGGDFEGELDRAGFGASFGMPFVANRVRLRGAGRRHPPLGGAQPSRRCSDCHRSTSIITTPIAITPTSDSSLSLNATGTR